jgi:GntR family transcriptional regulator
MEMYKVSRITIRQAVEKLADENLVIKQRGRGTFITLPTLRTDASQIITFEKDMLQRGLTPATQLIFSGIVAVSKVTAEKLQIQVGDE